MATLRQVEDHGSVIDDLIAVAIGELVPVWREFDLSDVGQTRNDLNQLLSAIVGDYGPMAMDIAMDWYDSLREVAGVGSSYDADGVELPTTERLQSLAGWATKPLVPAEIGDDIIEPVTLGPRLAEEQDALTRVTGGLQRVLADIDREVLQSNTYRDPAGPRYARHASASACAFCALLATREDDWLYRSKQSALRVVTTRGAQPLGEKYHDWCTCTAYPVWPGEDSEEAPYVQQWRELYQKASIDTGDLTAILANMREIGGLR